LVCTYSDSQVKLAERRECESSRGKLRECGERAPRNSYGTVSM
jgi:hypothetical protein